VISFTQVKPQRLPGESNWGRVTLSAPCDIQLCIQPNIKPGIKSGFKLGVRLGLKLGLNLSIGYFFLLGHCLPIQASQTIFQTVSLPNHSVKLDWQLTVFPHLLLTQTIQAKQFFKPQPIILPTASHLNLSTFGLPVNFPSTLQLKSASQAQLLNLNFPNQQPVPVTQALAQLGVDDYFERAFYYYNQGHYNSAIAYYNRVLSIDSAYAEAYNNRANAYASLGEFLTAISDYSQALKYEHPEPGLVYYNRGNTYFDMGRYSEAINDYSAAIAAHNSHLELIYYNRGNANFLLQRYDSALADYDQAIEADPTYASAYNNRGNARFYLDDDLGAITDYTEALALTAETDREQRQQQYYNRANVYYDLGNYEQAIADYSAALALAPEHADALYSRAISQMFLGERRSALIDLQAAIVLYNQAGNVEWYQYAQDLFDRWQ